MPLSRNADVLALHRALGATKPPDKITQEAFEFNDKHLRRLARLEPGESADAEDLWYYAKDVLYTKIQESLFVYLLPFCLGAWRDDLKGAYGYGGFVEYFYVVLAKPRIFDDQLSPWQAAAVSDFMKQVILDEIDEQRGLSYQGARVRPYRWVGALTTYGVLRPDLDSLWSDWWSIKTIGRAVAALQYVSCLMYPENENPVFAPWTPDGGGGPPCLWDFEGHLYEHGWRQENIGLLRATLTTHKVRETLTRSIEKLVGQPEHRTAQQLGEDFPLVTEIVEARCLELPSLLERPRSANSFQWSK